MKASYNKMSREILIELVNRGNVIECCGAICEIVRRKIDNGMVVGNTTMKEIEKRINDDSVFWNSYTVGDFATAAMHLLGRTQYEGDRIEVKSLIKAQMDFS